MPINSFTFILQNVNLMDITSKVSPYSPPPGGTDLERGYGDVRPWRPPFHASPIVHKGPISSKRVRSQDTQMLAHKAPNLEIFSSQALKFGNFWFTSPPFQRQISVRKPHVSEIRAANPYLKKKVSTPRASPPPKKKSVLQTPFPLGRAALYPRLFNWCNNAYFQCKRYQKYFHFTKDWKSFSSNEIFIRFNHLSLFY